MQEITSTLWNAMILLLGWEEKGKERKTVNTSYTSVRLVGKMVCA
jgi:hypothetical protein